MLYFCGCQAECTYIKGKIFSNHCLLVVIWCHAVIVIPFVWHITAINVLEIIGVFYYPPFAYGQDIS
jgi:hypothetical protein